MNAREGHCVGRKNVEEGDGIYRRCDDDADDAQRIDCGLSRKDCNSLMLGRRRARESVRGAMIVEGRIATIGIGDVEVVESRASSWLMMLGCFLSARYGLLNGVLALFWGWNSDLFVGMVSTVAGLRCTCSTLAFDIREEVEEGQA